MGLAKAKDDRARAIEQWLADHPGWSPARRAWTAGEEALLRQYYRRVPVAVLAAKIGRSIFGVRQKALGMGL